MRSRAATGSRPASAPPSWLPPPPDRAGVGSVSAATLVAIVVVAPALFAPLPALDRQGRRRGRWLQRHARDLNEHPHGLTDRGRRQLAARLPRLDVGDQGLGLDRSTARVRGRRHLL